MAALAFTSYGVHWFAIGWNRLRGTDPRVNVGMTIAFLLLSILGIIVFFKVGDDPVGGVFIGLACVYAADFWRASSLTCRNSAAPLSGCWASSVSARDSGSCISCSPWR